MDIQNYPTPEKLGRKAWGKFQNREFIRVLEPSAGKATLAKMRPKHNNKHYAPPVDCIEIDIEQHPILRENGFKVVGVDFMAFEGTGSIYSHIIMNPPFANGVHHVLKAWDIMYDGEIVAIINAETIRNPLSKERMHLKNLIEQHGSVEFIQDAFSDSDAERKTNVEVALVYLRKESNFDEDIYSSIMKDLKKDSSTGETLAEEFEENNQISLPGQYVKNTVLAFNAAVQAGRESVFTNARYNYHAMLLGDAFKNGADISVGDYSLSAVQKELQKMYDDLKHRAWSGILRSTEVNSRLSSKAQKRLESDFSVIKDLEFTVANIYSFLHGLTLNQGQIQADMACDVFDLILTYHSENQVFYKGWKSNDKHRTCGMRLKTTRFILPNNSTIFTSLSWEAERRLMDIDKIFAMLDGKQSPETSLCWVFDKHIDRLKQGERLSTSYFDVRYYPGAGTIHFFPRDKKLMDRLNLLVGRRRKWLPPDDVRVSDEFWLQYKQAEKFDKEVRKERDNSTTASRWNCAFNSITSKCEEVSSKAAEEINGYLDTVLQRHGIDPDALLEHKQELKQLCA